MQDGVIYISETDIFNLGGVELATLNSLFDDCVDNVIERCILHSTLEAFAEWRPDRECDHDIVCILLSSIAWALA